ncbi:hypothetical protein E8E13_004811 [Curvularia kusanoi]|uniref:SET domain-containing protein n=1 Tax=Curvularia kusanoi TaxID=90978 RepID=A0A9P4T711_CURKU|nr:hypothetical protein E8E13_004811 [Curvularia kusanoi]
MPPQSPHFSVLPTPTAGRAVFARTHIPKTTLLHRATDLSVTVILREYRREVCGHCFFYNRGLNLPIRVAATGYAFCSRECQGAWEDGVGATGVAAWEAVEKLVKGRSREDSEGVELDSLVRPGVEEVEGAWRGVESSAVLIRGARGVEEQQQASHEGLGPLGDEEVGGKGPVKPTKPQRRAVAAALQARISPDVMAFLVSGLVWRHAASSEEWDALVALADDATPYHSADDLSAFTRSYLHLLAILPLPLLPLCTPETLFLLSSRDSHNSFGIRSLDDEGSEFFGYGCWPSASYFNHSCGPNVEKVRNGRVWEFRAGRDVEEGEELSITYLSGEERRLGREKRMHTLRRNWGFDCACHRCREEEGKTRET